MVALVGVSNRAYPGGPLLPDPSPISEVEEEVGVTVLGLLSLRLRLLRSDMVSGYEG